VWIAQFEAAAEAIRVERPWFLVAVEDRIDCIAEGVAQNDPFAPVREAAREIPGDRTPGLAVVKAAASLAMQR
jgi:hypothetical protein